MKCMKEVIFMVDAQTEVMIKFFFTPRAAASDYDDWEDVHGNKGWSSKHLIPLFKKV